MDSTAPSVVSLEVQEDDSTVIVLRVKHQWICAEANRKDLQNTLICQQYDELVRGYRRQQTKDEQLAEDAGCIAKDSGYGSGEDVPGHKQSLEVEVAGGNGVALLQDWMVEVISSTCDNIPTRKGERRESTLADWYIAPISFYNFTANVQDAEHLLVEPREDLDGSKYIHDYLMPHIRAPKYVRDLDVPWYAPEDIIVEGECENEFGPIHPTLLSVPTEQIPLILPDQGGSSPSGSHRKGLTPNRTQYFFKLATHGDASSVKREIKILDTLRKKDLYSKGIRAPRLAGFVQMPQIFQDNQCNPKDKLLGILLTIVPPPAVPLNHYMIPEFKQEQRAAYAAEIQTMVEILHRHHIVWGDAKADNILIDGTGKLWMIDFGGSYTPGWIDAELADTREGDAMGTEKITLGLEYPKDFVQSEAGKDSKDDDDHNESVVSGTKRKREVQEDRKNTSEAENFEPRRRQQKRN